MSEKTPHKKVLITGGTGRLGISLRRILTGFSDVLTPSRHQLDLIDQLAIKNFLQKERVTHIIHAAGNTGNSNYQIENRNLFLEDNAKIDRNIIESSMDVGVTNLTYISSVSVFRDLNTLISEECFFNENLLNLDNPNSATKIEMTRLIAQLKDTEFNYKAILSSNAFGFLDESVNHNSLFPEKILSIYANCRNFEEVFTGTIPANILRDFISYHELSRFILQVSEVWAPGEIIISASGESISLLEFKLIHDSVFGVKDLPFRNIICQPKGNTFDVAKGINFGLRIEGQIKNTLLNLFK